MRKHRIVLAAVLLLCLLLGQSQSAFAKPIDHFAVRLTDATIPWLFPLTSACGEIPEGVEISPDDLGSDRVKAAIQRETPEGKQIVIADQVTGTASDNTGAAYTFIYRNVAARHFNGSIVLVHMLDYFELQGGDVHYIVTFNWRWAYPASSLDLVQVTDENGETVDLVVVPDIFATSDGVNEDPNIVPGSWQQLSTRGDPFNCDPL